MSRRNALAVVLFCSVLFGGSASPACAQQSPDDRFDTRVAQPAFAAHGLRVLFDDAHHNFHTTTGRYRPFVRLVTADGCRVTANRSAFSAATLAGADLLVIANALGHDNMGDTAAAHPAFTPEECDAVRDWVRAGGALLLIADHAPMGDAARELAARFGVEMRAAYTFDPARAVKHESSILAYESGRGLATDHPIVAGRDAGERVRRVVAFTGQSLRGPEGAASLLTLSDQARDFLMRMGDDPDAVPADRRISAASRSQGLAFEFGRGRVVVMGEAAMLTAQVAGFRRQPMGMNAPGNDDRQFALNVVRWLGRKL